MLAFAAAENVMGCDVPGVRLSVDGVAVTPAGRAESEMLTVPVNPLAATAEIATCWPEVPVVSESVFGLAAREKLGVGAAVTLSVMLAMCESDPDVAVRMRVLELADAVAPAVSVTDWGIPGLSVKDAGFAETPAGRPERTTATGVL